MGWSSPLHDPAWGKWVVAVAGSGPVRPGAKLDPYGTSWRVLSTQARRWLPQIEAGEDIEGSARRRDQTLIDLRAANLVEGGEAPALTSFGRAVLRRWENLPAAWVYELPLGVALLQEALIAQDPTFKGMLAFWWDARKRFADDNALLADEEAVLLLPYLNRTVDGYNPWVVLRASSGSLDLPISWAQLKSAVPSPTDATNNAIDRLRDVLDPSRRLKARVVLCRAMSLLFMRRENRGAIGEYLDDLKLPYRSER
jgi:hypothetical protein